MLKNSYVIQSPLLAVVMVQVLLLLLPSYVTVPMNIGVSASSLPSNALNRWTFIRGGETAALPPRSSSSSRSGSGGGKLIMDSTNNNSNGAKPKKKRRRRSSSSSSSSSSSPSTSNPPQSPPKKSKMKSVSRPKSRRAQETTKSDPPPSSSKSQPTKESKSNSSSSQETSNGQNSNKSSTAAAAAATAATAAAASKLVSFPPELLSSPIPTSTTSSTTSTSTTDAHDQMPSIFTPEESIYDKYAACIAATEGLRRIRDSKLVSQKKRGFRSAVNVDADSSILSSATSGWKTLLTKRSESGSDVGAGSSQPQQQQQQQQQQQLQRGNGSGNSNSVGVLSPEQQKEEYKRACAEYVLHSTKVIKALGLSVSQFNQLGREIKKNGPLKEKVMEQAYLYRMASTIKMDKIPLIQDPNSKKLLQSHKRRRVQMFVRSITEIEELRSEQMERLKRALNIDKLPPHMNLCDPNVLPLLNPKVRAVIEAFPLQAEVIVKKYGLNSDEFNSMLEETRGNPVFRWRVQRFKKKSDDDNFGMGSSTSNRNSGNKSNSQFGDFEF